jgi:hypothetical protein
MPATATAADELGAADTAALGSDETTDAGGAAGALNTGSGGGGGSGSGSGAAEADSAGATEALNASDAIGGACAEATALAVIFAEASPLARGGTGAGFALAEAAGVAEGACACATATPNRPPNAAANRATS